MDLLDIFCCALFTFGQRSYSNGLRSCIHTVVSLLWGQLAKYSKFSEQLPFQFYQIKFLPPHQLIDKDGINCLEALPSLHRGNLHTQHRSILFVSEIFNLISIEHFVLDKEENEFIKKCSFNTDVVRGTCKKHSKFFKWLLSYYNSL